MAPTRTHESAYKNKIKTKTRGIDTMVLIIKINVRGNCVSNARQQISYHMHAKTVYYMHAKHVRIICTPK